jgi:hypothetical protein
MTAKRARRTPFAELFTFSVMELQKNGLESPILTYLDRQKSAENMQKLQGLYTAH